MSDFVMEGRKKESIVLYYNEQGEPNNVESERVCAKYHEIIGSVKKYYVLFGISEALYNPNSDKITKKNKERFKLKTVNEECFNLYLNFLQKKDVKSFNKAKRLAVS